MQKTHYTRMFIQQVMPADPFSFAVFDEADGYFVMPLAAWGLAVEKEFAEDGSLIPFGPDDGAPQVIPLIQEAGCLCPAGESGTYAGSIINGYFDIDGRTGFNEFFRGAGRFTAELKALYESLHPAKSET